MSTRDLLVPSRYYRRLDDILGRHGVALQSVLERMQLPADAFDAPDGTVRHSQVERVIRLAEHLSGRTDLGFDLGPLLSLSTHSIVGFGMLTSPTADDAIRFVARYFRLVMPSFKLRYICKPDRGELHFTPTIAMSHQCLAFHLEAIALAALRDVKDLTSGNPPPCRLLFSIDEPRHRHRYESLADTQTLFAALSEPGITLIVGTDLRSVQLPMSDANALNVAEERCQLKLNQLTGERRYSEWVMMTLREVGNGGPSQDEMAKLLNLSARTLNRYLQREGSSFRSLAAQVHHELACQRLLGGTQSVTEIAYSLGYTCTSNFTRAFRGRAGCSPTDFRQRGAAAVN